MKLVLPAMPTTLSLSISFFASVRCCAGLSCSWYRMYLIGRPLDAAVVVDALEVRVGDLADRREVHARDQHVDAAELDRRTGRLLARPQTADGLRRRGLARTDGRLGARCPTGEHQSQQTRARGRPTDHRLRRSHGSLHLGRSRGRLDRIPRPPPRHATSGSRQVHPPHVDVPPRVPAPSRKGHERLRRARATEPERHLPKAVLDPPAHRRAAARRHLFPLARPGY